jgi:hypothetical protein
LFVLHIEEFYAQTEAFPGVLPVRSGHQSFSNNRHLNDLVGNITHSSIMVPYHGEQTIWRSNSEQRPLRLGPIFVPSIV